MPERNSGQTAEVAEEPFISWADEAFDPGPRSRRAAERTARALEYIAYQLFHIRPSLSELVAADETPERAGRRQRKS